MARRGCPDCSSPESHAFQTPSPQPACRVQKKKKQKSLGGHISCFTHDRTLRQSPGSSSQLRPHTNLIAGEEQAPHGGGPGRPSKSVDTALSAFLPSALTRSVASLEAEKDQKHRSESVPDARSEPDARPLPGPGRRMAVGARGAQARCPAPPGPLRVIWRASGLSACRMRMSRCQGPRGLPRDRPTRRASRCGDERRLAEGEIDVRLRR